MRDFNRCCPYQEDYENKKLLLWALNDVLTERYAILKKPMKRNWIFFSTDYIDQKLVHIPKSYQDNYEEKKIACMKEVLSLIDKGYSSPVTQETEEEWREKIAEYQMNKNEVWE